MPYIIVVIALVIASVGFTFFQSSHTAASKTPSEPLAIEHSNEKIVTSTLGQKISASDVAVTPDVPSEIITPTETPKPAPTPKSAPVPAMPVSTNAYKNGTYRTQASYRTPGGQYQIDITLSVSDDKITNTIVSFNAGASDSYSKAFSRAYQSSVAGENLGTVHPSRIGGASLTTRAFNSTLDTIRSQAT